jgi:hypothetical protein
LVHALDKYRAVTTPFPIDPQLLQLSDAATSHLRDDIYYHQNNSDFLIVRRSGEKVLGLLNSVGYCNPAFKEFPCFVVPKNLYSWADDRGQTALTLIKSLLALSQSPVVSDLEMTPQAKKFMQRQINNGELRARTLNLDTGDVSPYDSTIWSSDDDYRVLILNQPFGQPLSAPSSKIMETTWNHAQLLKRLRKR